MVCLIVDVDCYSRFSLDRFNPFTIDPQFDTGYSWISTEYVTALEQVADGLQVYRLVCGKGVYHGVR